MAFHSLNKRSCTVNLQSANPVFKKQCQWQLINQIRNMRDLFIYLVCSIHHNDVRKVLETLQLGVRCPCHTADLSVCCCHNVVIHPRFLQGRHDWGHQQENLPSVRLSCGYSYIDTVATGWLLCQRYADQSGTNRETVILLNGRHHEQ